MRCKTCKDEITPDMKLEYSMFATELFCCPDCALTYYFSYMENRPVSFEEALELVGEGYEEPESR